MIQNILLVIDPFLKKPANEGINVISRLHSELQKENNFTDSYLELFFPSHSEESLRSYFDRLNGRGKRVIGVISLGSFANVTDNLDWVNAFSKDIKDCVIEKNIPFLGICFSHQLLAWIYEANIGFVSDRENLPEKKYNEFRDISILHPRLKSIIGNKESFISKAKHEQEVKSIPDELELTCSSPHCKIEGLVHKKYAAFSVQSHPEEFHESREGWDFIKRFIRYFVKGDGSV